MTTQTYQQYDQVYVIIRVDTSVSRERAPESAVALLKALWTEAEAEAEVARLNQPNREQGYVYFWKAARLGRQLVEAGARVTSAS